MIDSETGEEKTSCYRTKDVRHHIFDTYQAEVSVSENTWEKVADSIVAEKVNPVEYVQRKIKKKQGIVFEGSDYNDNVSELAALIEEEALNYSPEEYEQSTLEEPEVEEPKLEEEKKETKEEKEASSPIPHTEGRAPPSFA